MIEKIYRAITRKSPRNIFIVNGKPLATNPKIASWEEDYSDYFVGRYDSSVTRAQLREDIEFALKEYEAANKVIQKYKTKYDSARNHLWTN